MRSLAICDADHAAGAVLYEPAVHLGVVERVAVFAAGLEATALLQIEVHRGSEWLDAAQIAGLLDGRPSEEIEHLTTKGHALACSILERNRVELEDVASALAACDLVNAETFASLIAGA